MRILIVTPSLAPAPFLRGGASSPASVAHSATSPSPRPFSPPAAARAAAAADGRRAAQGGAHARGGNHVSALRWAGKLRALGHRVRIGAEYRAGCELLIALHARRSAAAIEAACRDGVPVVLALTGTDLYRDLPAGDGAALRSVDLAAKVVVLQPLATRALPERHRDKARVILQSARAARPARLPDLFGDAFFLCVLGHLRPEKDPLLPARAARLLPAGSRARVLHIGGVIDEQLGVLAQKEMAQNPRYRWLGEKPRAEALALIAGADLLVHSSTIEGGANALGEAIASGVPVLSSRIDGSLGLLGEDYLGTFAPGDASALAELIDRCERDRAFSAELRLQIAARAEFFAPAREQEAWRDLLAEVSARASPATQQAPHRSRAEVLLGGGAPLASLGSRGPRAARDPSVISPASAAHSAASPSPAADGRRGAFGAVCARFGGDAAKSSRSARIFGSSRAERAPASYGVEPPPAPPASFAADVRAGLSSEPKRLPCRWFYDAAGSALFEAICRQPEYYLPRVEHAILRAHAFEMVAACPPGAALCELGSGSSTKTRWLIEAALARGPARYAPIDISAAALGEATRDLSARYPALPICALCGEYAQALPELWRRIEPPRLLLWLGSNIGNFDRPAAAEFLAGLSARMHGSDRLLVGLDLRPGPNKDRRMIERAYDDAAGVTARFNKNLLARVNRELGAGFDLLAFAHRARYDADHGRIDMHLVSLRAQQVAIPGASLVAHFSAGEAIHTESSYKHDEREIAAMAAQAGLRVEERWLDGEQLFADYLLAPR